MSRLLWFVLGGLTTVVGVGVAALALDDSGSGSSESDEIVSKDDNEESETEDSKTDIYPKDILSIGQGDATDGKGDKSED